MTDKPHLSATQLEMMWKCGEQYRRVYIEGERLPPGIALLEGRAMHRGAEVNFKQKIDSHRDLPVSDIIEAAVAAFEADLAGGYALSDDEASRGSRVVLGEAKDQAARLAEAHAKLQAPDYQPVAVEHTSRIVLPGATHDLLGITDLRDDQDRVVDLKTAARAPAKSAADTSTQLTVYAAAFQVETGRPAAEVRLDVVTKTKRPGRHVVSSQRGPADFAALAARINTTLAAIHTGVFLPASPGSFWCSTGWCGFARSCPYFNPERERQAAAESE